MSWYPDLQWQATCFDSPLSLCKRVKTSLTVYHNSGIEDNNNNFTLPDVMFETHDLQMWSQALLMLLMYRNKAFTWLVIAISCEVDVFPIMPIYCSFTFIRFLKCYFFSSSELYLFQCWTLVDFFVLYFCTQLVCKHNIAIVIYSFKFVSNSIYIDKYYGLMYMFRWLKCHNIHYIVL